MAMHMAPLGWTCVKNETPKLKHGCTAYRSLPYLNLYPYPYLEVVCAPFVTVRAQPAYARPQASPCQNWPAALRAARNDSARGETQPRGVQGRRPPSRRGQHPCPWQSSPRCARQRRRSRPRHRHRRRRQSASSPARAPLCK
eukprot:scaffold818_cov64-Phaeocystis_antarctica.AAC.11